MFSHLAVKKVQGILFFLGVEDKNLFFGVEDKNLFQEASFRKDFCTLGRKLNIA